MKYEKTLKDTHEYLREARRELNRQQFDIECCADCTSCPSSRECKNLEDSMRIIKEAMNEIRKIVKRSEVYHE